MITSTKVGEGTQRAQRLPRVVFAHELEVANRDQKSLLSTHGDT
jgi:hypothetical protein